MYIFLNFEYDNIYFFKLCVNDKNDVKVVLVKIYLFFYVEIKEICFGINYIFLY